jgi:hypothetical protein
MEFTRYLNKEDELEVWTSAFNNLRKPLTVLTESAYKKDLYVRNNLFNIQMKNYYC